MRMNDLAASAWLNLRRRRSRTLLTAAGVMIGCVSIVVMMSIGQGLESSQKAMLEDMGDLRSIIVYSYDQSTRLDASAVETIQNLDHVKSAAGRLSFNEMTTQISAQNNRYQLDWAEIVGVDSSQLQDLGYTLLEGSDQLNGSSSVIPVLIGQMTAYNLVDTLRPESSSRVEVDYQAMYDQKDDYEWPDPFVDPLKTTFDFTISLPDAPEQSRTYQLKPVGILEENYNLGSETSSGFVMDQQAMEQILKDLASAGQLAYKQPDFESILVQADSMETVSDVEQAIQAAGYPNTQSMMSIRESLNEGTRTIQLILGGIGAVSLLVAAIGITNTMIMSISERTREIGIMKALGCQTQDIRRMFLLEAAMIGLAGGLAGLLLSFLASLGINYFAYAYTQSSGGFLDFLLHSSSRPSVIPLWLAAFGILFSAAIGLISGFYPARKAVKIPALEAIRHE